MAPKTVTRKQCDGRTAQTGSSSVIQLLSFFIQAWNLLKLIRVC